MSTTPQRFAQFESNVAQQESPSIRTASNVQIVSIGPPRGQSPRHYDPLPSGSAFVVGRPPPPRQLPGGSQVRSNSQHIDKDDRSISKEPPQRVLYRPPSPPSSRLISTSPRRASGSPGNITTIRTPGGSTVVPLGSPRTSGAPVAASPVQNAANTIPQSSSERLPSHPLMTPTRAATNAGPTGTSPLPSAATPLQELSAIRLLRQSVASSEPRGPSLVGNGETQPSGHSPNNIHHNISVANPGSSSDAFYVRRVDELQRLVYEKEAQAHLLAERNNREQRELYEIIRLNREELLQTRKQVDAMRIELHDAQRREQEAIKEQDLTITSKQTSDATLEECQQEVDRLRQLLKKRNDDNRRLDELSVARAKELAILSVARNRAEQRIGLLESELSDTKEELYKKREASKNKVQSLNNEVAKLQDENKRTLTILQQSKRTIQTLEEELTTVRSERDEEVTLHRDAVENHRQDTDALSNQLRRQKSEYDAAIAEAQARVEALQEEVETLKQRLEAEERNKHEIQLDVSALTRRSTDQQGLLMQCDVTMTSLDDENKKLVETNQELREKVEELKESVETFKGRAEHLAQLVHTLEDEKRALVRSSEGLQGSLLKAMTELESTKERLDVVSDELDGTVSTLEQTRRDSGDQIAEIQHAAVTQKRRHEEEVGQLAATIAQLRRENTSLAESLQRTQETLETEKLHEVRLAKLEAERALHTAVAEAEVNVMRREVNRRQLLEEDIRSSVESDPRVRRSAYLTRVVALCSSVLKAAPTDSSCSHLSESFDAAIASGDANSLLEALEEIHRGAICSEALTTLTLILNSAASHKRIAESDSMVASLSSEQEANGHRIQRLVTSLETATDELFVARTELADFEAQNIPFLVSTRAEVAKTMSELFLRSRLSRRRFRTLLGLPSWRTLVKEHLVPDDFGQTLCDIVDDSQWIYDKHKYIVEHYCTEVEREQWGVVVAPQDTAMASPQNTAAMMAAD